MKTSTAFPHALQGKFFDATAPAFLLIVRPKRVLTQRRSTDCKLFRAGEMAHKCAQEFAREDRHQCPWALSAHPIMVNTNLYELLRLQGMETG